MPFPPPTITPPTLSDFQWQYKGYTFGAETPLGVLKVEGLDLAPIRSGDQPWPRDHGQARGLDLFDGRDVIFDLWEKTDGSSLQKTQLELAAATNILPDEESPLWFQLPNLPTLCIMCRVRKRPTRVNANYAAAQVAEPELVLHATDPRIYTGGKTTALTRNTPVTVTNEGNTEMRPIVILTGPLSLPRISNKTVRGDPYIELENLEYREKREAEEAAKRETRRNEYEIKEEEIKALGIDQRAAYKKEYEETKISKAELEAKDAASEASEVKSLKEAKEKEEKENKEELEAGEKAEKEKYEKGELLIVAAGDQVLIDFGNPHLVQYYKEGIEAGHEPENFAKYITTSSSWWDILAGANSIEFSSADTTTTGHAEIQWASAYEL